MSLESLSLAELEAEAFDLALTVKGLYDAPVCDYRKVVDDSANLVDIVLEIGRRKGKA